MLVILLFAYNRTYGGRYIIVVDFVIYIRAVDLLQVYVLHLLNHELEVSFFGPENKSQY